MKLVLGSTPAWWGQAPTTEALEFTLKDGAGADVTVPVVAKPTAKDVMVQVVVEVPSEYTAGYDFEINVESAGPEGTVGQVMAQDTTGLYHVIPTMEGKSTYGTDTADFAHGAALYPIRRTFALHQAINPNYLHSSTTAYPFPHIVLRIKQTHVNVGAESRFDLVQVVPLTFYVGDGEGDPESIAEADVNADGNVDVDDIGTFNEGWLEGGVVADIDCNGAVDDEDAARFLESYSQQQTGP